MLFVAPAALSGQQHDDSVFDPSADFGPTERSVRAVERFIAAYNAADDSALAAAFGPQAEAYEYAPGFDRFQRIDWLPDPWRRLGLEVPATADSRVTVLDRVVSGSFVTQRERLAWRGDDSRGRLVRTVLYKVRGGRIHRVWYAPAEPDAGAVSDIAAPDFPPDAGPTVWIDAFHHNMHTPEGSYWPLAELLRRHGYRVRTWEAPFATAALDTVRLLVVANALPAAGIGGRSSDSAAFADREIEALVRWVQNGGALLLIADHAPFGGAAATLAARFGAEFHNGLARDTSRRRGSNIMFRRRDATLRRHPIRDGARPGAHVDSVATFAGQAFRAGVSLQPLLVLPEATVLETRRSTGDAEQPAERNRTPAGGWLQAAVRELGEGRVALFGEAALFRHLEVEHGSMRGAQNARLVANVFRWLPSGIAGNRQKRER